MKPDPTKPDKDVKVPAYVELHEAPDIVDFTSAGLPMLVVVVLWLVFAAALMG